MYEVAFEFSLNLNPNPFGPLAANDIKGYMSLACAFFRPVKNLHDPNPQNLSPFETKNARVKEFLHLSSENCMSWIFGLLFENAVYNEKTICAKEREKL